MNWSAGDVLVFYIIPSGEIIVRSYSLPLPLYFSQAGRGKGERFLN